VRDLEVVRDLRGSEPLRNPLSHLLSAAHVSCKPTWVLVITATANAAWYNSAPLGTHGSASAGTRALGIDPVDHACAKEAGGSQRAAAIRALASARWVARLPSTVLR
jgi:hypothetical protein